MMISSNCRRDQCIADAIEARARIPIKMQLIQELISVSLDFELIFDLFTDIQELLGQMVSYTRKGHGIRGRCPQYHQGYPRSLDLAKKNLILSMTTLKRLQMLGVSSTS